MVRLSRIVRFGIGSGPADSGGGGNNGLGGTPRFPGWPSGHWIEVCVECRGEVDPSTGYFLDIKAIDQATREALIGPMTASLTGSTGELGVLAESFVALRQRLGGGLVRLCWNLTPTYSVEVSNVTSGTQAAQAIIRQRFEIAAAHRLFVPGLSDEENRRLFGKCAGVGGHGHNYVIEPAVRVTIGGGFGLPQLERVTVTALIEPFDHKNLNQDCQEFDQSRGGVNPSVENICRVFYERLRPVVSGAGAELVNLTVWETEKTSSTYPG